MKALKRHLKTILIVGLALLFSALSVVDAKNAKGEKGNSGNNNTGSTSSVIGDWTGLTTTKYHLSSWTVKNDYEILGPTIMVIDNDLDIGNHKITIAQTGSLTLYIGGNISVTGNGGINNTGVPSQLMVLGTHPEKQAGETPDFSLTLNGNGSLTGVVYAPNAEYRSNGGGNAGQTSGAVVALDVVFNGSPGPFHFDEALKDIETPFPGFNLDRYDLRQASDFAPSKDAKAVVGENDYDSLFNKLFK